MSSDSHTRSAFVTTASDELLEQKRRDLVKMRRFATGLLVLMVVAFIACSIGERSLPWLGFIRAFTEAAMIGALADWFAVTALFRYPLGIPIPHTAIVQQNKDRIGESLGNFVENNFLTADALEAKLQEVDIAGKLADWLDEPENSAELAQRISMSIPTILQQVDDEKINRFVDLNVSERLEHIEVAPLAGTLLTTLTSRNKHQDLLDQSVKIAASFLGKNKDLIREKIKAESPWFVPKYVDDKIYERIIDKIEQTLVEIESNPQHEMRAKFNVAVLDFIERLKSSDEYRAKGEQIKQELLQHPTTRRTIRNFWQDVKQRILSDLAQPESAISTKLRETIEHVGSNLQKDQAQRDRINQWIRQTAVQLLLERRSEIGSLISDTVKRWDGQTMSDRVELHVGRDLQFIRINGTIVGGIVGLIIYSIAQWAF